MVDSASWASPHGLSPLDLWRRWRLRYPVRFYFSAGEWRPGEGVAEVHIVLFGREWHRVWLWSTVGSTGWRRIAA